MKLWSPDGKQHVNCDSSQVELLLASGFTKQKPEENPPELKKSSKPVEKVSEPVEIVDELETDDVADDKPPTKRKIVKKTSK